MNTRKIFYTVFLFSGISVSSYAQDLNGEQIYKKVNDAVVTIYTYDYQNQISQGSGVVLNDEGFVITNWHVFVGGDKIEVHHGTKNVDEVNFIGADPEKDILILKIPKGVFPSLAIGNSDSLSVGQKVFAIGSPLGFENTLSEGIVSGLRGQEVGTRNFIQMTAPISSGSSGGAVVNAKGELIGISTMTIRGSQNLNFAIPINEVLSVPLQNYTDTVEVRKYNFYTKGYSAHCVGNHDKEVKLYKQIFEKDPEYSLAYNGIGVCLFESKKYDDAIQYYRQAIRFNPQYTVAYFHIGQSYYHKAVYDSAEVYFKKAIELKPNFTEAYNNLALTYFTKGDYESAISYYKKSSEIDSRDPISYTQLAQVYVKKEMYEAAFQNLKEALKRTPDFIPAKIALAKVYLLRSEYDEAIRTLEAVIQKNPAAGQMEFLYFYLGEAYFIRALYQTDNDNAIQNLREAVKIKTDFADAYYFLGLAFKVAKKNDLAKENLAKAFQLKPELKNRKDEKALIILE